MEIGFEGCGSQALAERLLNKERRSGKSGVGESCLQGLY